MSQFEICGGIAEILAVEIPFSAAQLEKASLRRVSKAVDGALLRLKNKRAASVVFSDVVKSCCKLKTEEYPCGKDIFYMVVPDCIRGFSKKCGVELRYACVGISDSDSGRISEYLTEALAPYVRTVRLCSENISAARRLCDKVFEDTGMPMSVCADIVDSGRDEIFIDICHGTVRIGRDLTLDGAEFDIDLKDYRADTSDVAACLGGVGVLKKVKAYTSGKKKLTL